MGDHRHPSVDRRAARGAPMQISTRRSQSGRQSQIAQRVFGGAPGSQGIARLDLAARVRHHGGVGGGNVKGMCWQIKKLHTALYSA